MRSVEGAVDLGRSKDAGIAFQIAAVRWKGLPCSLADRPSGRADPDPMDMPCFFLARLSHIELLHPEEEDLNP